jgi:UDP-N-acetylglucosamine diphosphorylase/glucosamine-1-phosphate N-acetyltransferase
MAAKRIVFEDGGGRLGPLTDLRTAAEIRNGAFVSWQRLQAESVLMSAMRAESAAARIGVPVNTLPKGESFLLLNSRLLEEPATVRKLRDGQALVDAEDGSIVAACLGADAARAVIDARWPDALQRETCADALMLRRPWDLLANEAFERRLIADADTLARRWKKTGELAKPSQIAAWRNEKGKSWSMRWTGKRTRPIAFEGDAIVVHASAHVDAFVVLDSRGGPVVIDRDAHIGAHAVLQGPVYVGPGTVVAPGALLKPRTVFGQRCRAAGEVGGTIFHGDSNKAHDGHLGDALVGRWVNLGAGTVNSNLLNTYGEVSMRVDGDAPLERTGRQFMGCILGDHVKTAIGTRIMTGTTIGTGAMIACSVPPPSCTPRFAWLTDDGQKVHRLDRFLSTAEIVMKRRGESLQPAERAAIQALHARAVGNAS